MIPVNYQQAENEDNIHNSSAYRPLLLSRLIWLHIITAYLKQDIWIQIKYCYLFKMCSVIILIQMHVYSFLNVSKEDYNFKIAFRKV